MRLSQKQSQLIIETVRSVVNEEASISLFGSRLDDGAKGGDVDLFVESDQPIPLMQRAQIKMLLETRLELPVDLVCKTRGAKASAFQQIAQGSAVKLSAER